ncbi:aldose epimerase family protein [Flavobacterium sp.]|uniref:aldose epimerase family protein n=1 Tax=Flavobacterium sp. TaxID=239 RepID=UPI002625346B|nr:aldose epimerase family protein [Flavobacterium sp.]
MENKHIPHFLSPAIANLADVDPNKPEIATYEIGNAKGMKLCATNFGATVMSLKVPAGTQLLDVVLGFDNVENYMSSFSLPSAPYLGATVGRYAGRIGNAEFTLNGRKIKLDKNNGENSLHGGNRGLSRAHWQVQSLLGNAVVFSYKSHDGEDCFPGELQIKLTYQLSDNNEFIVEYEALAKEDTVINLTHHSYFNLEGHKESVVKQKLFVNSEKFLETDGQNVPTGNLINVGVSDFDFRFPKNCPEKIDNTFVLNKKDSLAASLYSINNQLKMEVHTDQPGLHLYVGGNCFNQIDGKEYAKYHATSGICFETQNYPDAPNHAHFPNSILKKGEVYRHKTIYHFITL